MTNFYIKEVLKEIGFPDSFYEKDQTKPITISSISRSRFISILIKDPKNLSNILGQSLFTNDPSISLVNIIILTLSEIIEEPNFTWEQFSELIKITYEYIEKWKEKEDSMLLYKKIISEMLPIIDNYYQAKNGNINPTIMKLIEESQSENSIVYASLKYLPALPPLKSKEDFLEELLALLFHRVQLELRNVKNKKESLHFNYLQELFLLLKCHEEKPKILESLLKSRFDKRNFKSYLTHSIILGADAGIYVLLNSISKTEKKILLLDSHINLEILPLIIKKTGKVIIGEGSFGKIRLAMAIIPNKKKETSLLGGNIICVKKAGSKKRKKENLEICQSTWNDYCSIDFLDDAPEIFDMRITVGCDNCLQGYCFQRLLMLPNGRIFYKNEEYQKWLHVKPYFIGIFSLMIDLHEKGICMTDLKPGNTLYDRKTKISKLVDLAGAVRSKDLTSFKTKSVSEYTLKYTAPELKAGNEEKIDLTKCISWTVGQMMEEISLKIKESEFDKIKSQVNSLCDKLKLNSPVKRLSLQKGLKKLKEIHDLEPIAENDNFETYVHALKDKFIKEDTNIQSILNLKNDIYTLCNCFNHKLKVSMKNPEIYECDPSTDKSIKDLIPELKKMIYDDSVAPCEKDALILFGSAGSGKSTVLQKVFIDAIKSWKFGDPVPIFMNLARDRDLRNYWNKIKNYLVLEYLNFEDLIKSPVVLFLDSLDESGMDIRVIMSIFNLLSTYANVNTIKIIITCRTGYFNEDNGMIKLKDKINLNVRYIIPLDVFFFENGSDLKKLIVLYLKEWEKKQSSETKELVSSYLQIIQQYHLKKMMKTTFMIFIILKIMPKLMSLEFSWKKEINLLKVYDLYLEKNFEHEISRSKNKLIKKKNVSWFMEIGVMLAEKMMMTKKATNQLRKNKVFEFFFDCLNKQIEIGEEYNAKLPLTENVEIYSILRTLNLNIHFEKIPPNEEITLSFPHDTIKNFFLTKGFSDKLLLNNEFPEWISQKNITENKNLIRFMVEAIKGSFELGEKSEIAILSTKHSEDPKTITRAANLITILVASNYSFYGKDLSHIKIRGADISDGIFHGCNFDHVDLSEVILNDVKMDGASFHNTNLNGVKLDIYPYIDGNSSLLSSIAFSPNGEKIVSGGKDDTITIWDLETGKEIKKMLNPAPTNAVAFSPQGDKIVSGGSDNLLRVWDVETGQEIKRYEGHSNYVNSVSFSPQGNKLGSGSDDKTIRIWDVKTGVELFKIEGHSDPVYSVAFSPKGDQIVSGSSDKSVRIWSVETGKELKNFVGDLKWATSVAFSPNGNKLVGACFMGNIMIWDLQTDEKSEINEGGSLSSVAFSPNGDYIVTGSYENKVTIWDVETGKELKKYFGHFDSVQTVAFSPLGKTIISGSVDGRIMRWNVEIRPKLKKYEGHYDQVNSVVFFPQGDKIVSGSDDQTIKIWDLKTGKKLKILEGHSDSVSSVALSPKGDKIISGSLDKTIKIWDVESGKELKNLVGHSDKISVVSFSPKGNSFASVCRGDKAVIIWDVESGKELRRLIGHSDSVCSIVISPNGEKLLSGSSDKTAKLWDFNTGKELQNFKGHSRSVRSVAFSPQSNQIASGSEDKTVRIWDLETGKEVKKHLKHYRPVISVAFTPEGDRIISGSDEVIRIWDLETGKEVKKYKGHSDSVSSIALSPQGDKFVSCSWDMSIRIWDLELGNETPKKEGEIDLLFSPKKIRVGKSELKTNLVEFESKNAALIISLEATAFSCLNCFNYEKSFQCPPQLLSLFKQNDRTLNNANGLENEENEENEDDESEERDGESDDNDADDNVTSEEEENDQT